MAQPVFSATERTISSPHQSPTLYAPFCKVRVRFGLLSLLGWVRWIALGALCAKGLWCRNASARQANAATVPPMRSLRQYIMFDTLALCERTEYRMADRSNAGFSNFNRALGSESLQQDRKHCQFAPWVRRVFFLLPFFFKEPNLAARGYKRRHTSIDRASFRVLKGLNFFWA